MGLGILFMFNPIDYGWMPRCLVKQFTGFSCPGCGLLRAVHAALHGRFAEAVSYNYWLVLTVPYVAALVVVRLLPKGAVKEKTQRLLGSRCVIGFYIATFLAWFVVRNVWGV